MHITTGKLKGRKLEMPMDKDIRPTPAKVKEAIFSMVGHDLQGNVVLDLFSGTGNLGLEAISRGADRVYFGEKSKTAFRLISNNISICKVSNQCMLIQGDWEYVLTRIPEPVDIIFLDPPYEAGLMEACIKDIWDKKLLAADGIITAEHDVRQILPEKIGGFSVLKSKKYGNTVVTLFTITSEETSL